MPLTVCALLCDFDAMEGVNVTECELLKTVSDLELISFESEADGSGLASVIREPVASLLYIQRFFFQNNFRVHK